MIVLGEQLLSSVLLTTSLPLRAIDPHDCFEAVMGINSPQGQRSREQHTREQLFTKNNHEQPPRSEPQGLLPS